MESCLIVSTLYPQADGKVTSPPTFSIFGESDATFAISKSFDQIFVSRAGADALRAARAPSGTDSATGADAQGATSSTDSVHSEP